MFEGKLKFLILLEFNVNKSFLMRNTILLLYVFIPSLQWIFDDTENTVKKKTDLRHNRDIYIIKM